MLKNIIEARVMSAVIVVLLLLMLAACVCVCVSVLQLLTCLMSCLVVDRQSLSTWRQVYIKHLPQSRSADVHYIFYMYFLF